MSVIYEYVTKKGDYFWARQVSDPGVCTKCGTYRTNTQTQAAPLDPWRYECTPCFNTRCSISILSMMTPSYIEFIRERNAQLRFNQEWHRFLVSFRLLQ